MPTDKNSMSYWFPPIHAAGLPVPRTEMFRIGGGLTDLLDGGLVHGFEHLVNELSRSAMRIGYPVFLRTGHTSGKHSWKNTCFVERPADLGQHVVNLVEQSALADLMGLPTEVWVVRELLPTLPLFHCRAYGGMPVVREFRLFANSEGVEHVQAYWPEEAVGQGDPDDPDWRRLLAMHSLAKDDELHLLCELATRAAGAVDDGTWSVDVLQTATRAWHVTDMAEGGRSFRYESDEQASLTARALRFNGS